MTKRELLDLCLELPQTYEDYPFDDTNAVVRHSGNKKIFALLFERGGKTYINLKCEPMRADFLRSVFRSVTPGWHMNKQHWNTIDMDGDVSLDDLIGMIQHSFDLTKPKMRRLKKAVD